MSLHKYYHISPKKFKNLILEPRIPSNYLVNNGLEDGVTPRICVSQSILGCFEAIDNPYMQRKRFYLYSCEVDSSNVVQPTTDQVEDVILTGEEWLLQPTKFNLESILHVSVMPLNDEYSKYTIKDREKDGKIIFSYINRDHKRVIKKLKEYSSSCRKVVV